MNLTPRFIEARHSAFLDLKLLFRASGQHITLMRHYMSLSYWGWFNDIEWFSIL